MIKKLCTLLALAFCLNGKAQIITTVAGNGAGSPTYTCCFGGDGGQATAAELNSPTRVTFDIVGNMYIADSYNNRIRKVNTSGIITTLAGNGTAGFSGSCPAGVIVQGGIITACQ